MEKFLCMIIVPMGYGDKVVKAAHDAGANSSTVLRARGANSEKEGLFSIKIEPKEEIVMITADKEAAKAVCTKINEEFEQHKDYSGTIYLLPIQS